jgi:hypothetical protein
MWYVFVTIILFYSLSWERRSVIPDGLAQGVGGAEVFLLHFLPAGTEKLLKTTSWQEKTPSKECYKHIHNYILFTKSSNSSKWEKFLKTFSQKTKWKIIPLKAY